MNVDEKIKQGCYLLDSGKPEEAIILFNEVIAEDAEQYFAINKLGVAYARQSDLVEAEEMFQRCLQVDSEYVPAIVNLANISKQKGEISKAIELYNKAIEKDPDYYYSYYNLASVYKSQKDFNQYFFYLKKYKKAYKHYISVATKENKQVVKERMNTRTLSIIISAMILGVFVLYKVMSRQ